MEDLGDLELVLALETTGLGSAVVSDLTLMRRSFSKCGRWTLRPHNEYGLCYFGETHQSIPNMTGTAVHANIGRGAEYPNHPFEPDLFGQRCST